MGILGIKNRTENWKTVQHFYGLDDDAKIRLVEQLGEPAGTSAGEIQVELFWYGVRDYLKAKKLPTKHQADAFAASYLKCFCNLREEVRAFNGFEPLQCHNYDACKKYPTNKSDKLSDNLRGTEIDIVLETQNHLFIGEAKDESGFGTNGTLVLVHQLIREYVMAKILVDLVAESDKDKKRKVVPFVIGASDKLESLKNTAQVKFMVAQGWLKEKNMLSWCDIKKLTNENSNPGA